MAGVAPPAILLKPALGQVRPTWAPRPLGLGSENAAHRIAVEWDGPDGLDCTLLMRGLPARWRPLPAMAIEPYGSAGTDRTSSDLRKPVAHRVGWHP